MNANDKEQLVKIIVYGVAIFIAYQLLIWLFKYVVACLAILGIGYLFFEYQKQNRRW
jgi:hypothetical protein